MSLYIDVDRVAAVLLSDGWHEVQDKSFDLDAYEYGRGDIPKFVGGQNIETIPSTGFIFSSYGRYYCGPLTAIHAVRLGPKE